MKQAILHLSLVPEALGFLFLSSVLHAQTPVADTISGVWTKENSPCLLRADVRVPAEDTLVIEPGVTVLAEGRYFFYVDGVLLARGTETDSIVFNAAAGQPAWAGIRLFNRSKKSELAYCRIQLCDDTAVWITGPASITHCYLTGNHHAGFAGRGGALRCQDADQWIPFNLIFNSSNGDEILDLSGGAVIRHNDVWNNHPYDYVNAGPGEDDISADPLFTGNYRLTSAK